MPPIADPFAEEDILQMIQNTVIEPPDWGVSWPSGLWSRSEVLQYLNDRQNNFLKNTQFQFGIAQIDVTAGENQFDLPDDWITTVRVRWIGSDGTEVELPRSDTWEADYGIPTWSYVEGTPKIFWDGGKPISIRLMPLPDVDGTLEVHYVPYAALLTGDGELFALPPEFVHFVRYGALADMFSKVGRAQDRARAEYCERRYQMGLQIARLLTGGFD